MLSSKSAQDKPLNDEELLLKDVKTIVASSAPNELKTEIIREMLLIFADKATLKSKGFHQKVSEAMTASDKSNNKKIGWLQHVICK